MVLSIDLKRELKNDIQLIIQKLIDLLELKGVSYFCENQEISEKFVDTIKGLERLIKFGDFLIGELKIGHKQWLILLSIVELLEQEEGENIG